MTLEKRDQNNIIVQSISFTAEGLVAIPNVNNALEYLNYADTYCKKHFSKNYPKYTVVDIDTMRLANRLFLVQTTNIQQDSDILYYQKTYSAQYGEYLLNILVNYDTEDQLKEIVGILNKITWKSE